MTGGEVSNYSRASEVMPGTMTRFTLTEGWAPEYSSLRRQGKNISLEANAFESRGSVILADFEDLSMGAYDFGKMAASYTEPGASIGFETELGHNIYKEAYAAQEGGGLVHTSPTQTEYFDTPNFGVDMWGEKKKGWVLSGGGVHPLTKGPKVFTKMGDKFQFVPIDDVLDAEGRAMNVSHVYSIREAREKGTLAALIQELSGVKAPEDPEAVEGWVKQMVEKHTVEYQLELDGNRTNVAKGLRFDNAPLRYTDNLGHVYPENPWGGSGSLDTPAQTKEIVNFVEKVTAQKQSGREVQRAITKVLAEEEVTKSLQEALPMRRALNDLSKKAVEAATTKNHTAFGLELGAWVQKARRSDLVKIMTNVIRRG
jgi:hypothetical protein